MRHQVVEVGHAAGEARQAEQRNALPLVAVGQLGAILGAETGYLGHVAQGGMGRGRAEGLSWPLIADRSACRDGPGTKPVAQVGEAGRMADSSAVEDRPKSKRVAALRGLVPFLWPYRGLLGAALLALILTATVSLILPLAVRRVVDGFNDANAALLDQYFAAALVIAALLAVGTGLRYYLVSRLGERVVADIRRALFDRVLGMSPAFFEKILTGEVLSRITTDTTLILSVIGSSVSVALRNVLILVGGLVLLFLTSAKLAGLVLLIVPAIIVPIVVLGRKLRALSRENQDWIAASSGSASEALTSVQTVQAFTHEAATRSQFADVTEKSFAAAKARIGTRAMMTVIVIFLTFAGIVCVLWVGARDVRADAMSVGALIQFVIYAVMVAGAVGALSEIWGELQRAAGATERLVELLGTEDSVQDPLRPVALPRPVRGEIAFQDVTFRYPAAARGFGAERRQPACEAGRDGGAGRAVGGGQDDDPATPDAFLRPAVGPRSRWTGQPCPTWLAPTSASRSRWCRRTR
jgi:ABC-type multidrug transport system fused ATPase/permease subunit